MTVLHITDLEVAINYWRKHAPSTDGVALTPEVQVLAEVYGQMVFRHMVEIHTESLPTQAMAAWQAWYDTTPDTPCIAICSTSQGDDWCKGCGRSFEEVQHWLAYTPMQKRAVWRRITQQGSAWRFTRYIERATQS
ncbi:MAG: DUF3717 domain-containing protein [Burkholderiaceae bacterium]|nr:DUF3717 domain-containing protein [Burkholderiaceae bacterium]